MGEISKVKIIESDCKSCDAKTIGRLKDEVINVIKTTPAIKPATDKSGQPVTQKYVLPMTVVLKDETN